MCDKVVDEVIKESRKKRCFIFCSNFYNFDTLYIGKGEMDGLKRVQPQSYIKT